VRFRHDAPYIVLSIRSPGDSIPRLRPDPQRVARINLAFHDTTPEWEERSLEPLIPMSRQDAGRIARFVASHWGRSMIVIHCVAGISRSAGVAAGILDAMSIDAAEFEVPPYDPNPHVRPLVAQELRRRLG
jgi:predicted protein tyrosine phosphatase